MTALSASSPSIPTAPPATDPKAPQSVAPGGAPPPPSKGVAGPDAEIEALEAAGKPDKKPAPKPPPRADVKPPEKTDETKAEPPKTEKQKIRLKTKVDGEEEEAEYDEDSLRVLVQKAKAADKRIKETTQAKKEREAFELRLKNDPFGALKERGIDALELAAQELIRQHEESQLPPEQREFLAQKRALEQERARIDNDKKKQEDMRDRAEEAHYFEQYAKSYKEAAVVLNYDDEFTATHVVPEMARLERPFVDAGIELQPKDLVRLVEEKHDTIAARRLQGLTGDALLTRLDKLAPGVVEEVRKAIVARHRAQTGAPVAVEPVRRERTDKSLPLTRRDERDAMLKLGSLR